MPKNKVNQLDFRGLEILADEFTGLQNGSLASIVKVTNNTGGTVSNTAAVVPAATAATTDTSAASLTSTNAAITAIKNDLAVVVAKVNEILNALD